MTQTIGAITINPLVGNVGWTGSVTLMEANKTRVKTTKAGVAACTSIALGAAQNLSKQGDALCAGNGEVQFSFCQLTQNSVFTITPDVYIELVFKGAGCIDAVTIPIISLKRNGDPTTCIPSYNQGPYNNIPICMGTIFGSIKTELGEPVQSVTVELALDGSNQFQPQTCNSTVCPNQTFNDPGQMGTGTGKSGAYGFCACDDCRYFTVSAERTDNQLNGVTTYDCVLISKHILGLEPLNSSYKMIAADVNKSKSITTFDVVELRKLILGIYTEFPSNNSWRIVNPVKIPALPATPFDYIDEFISGIDKDAYPYSHNFIGI